jgi:drug/metabolite transporter (DMT)-like permease
MARMADINRRRVFWLGTAVAAIVAAALLSPASVLARLDGTAERFREELVEGINLVRLGLIATGLLALATLAWWPQDADIEPEARWRSLNGRDWLLALGLFLLATILAQSDWFILVG